eukprot:g40535.t1
MKEEVLGVLKYIKVDKFPGPDGIYPKLLWEAREELAGALTDIFASSLASDEVPEDWRISNVVPLFKKGNRDNLGNYKMAKPYICPPKGPTILAIILETYAPELVLSQVKIFQYGYNVENCPGSNDDHEAIVDYRKNLFGSLMSFREKLVILTWSTRDSRPTAICLTFNCPLVIVVGWLAEL